MPQIIIGIFGFLLIVIALIFLLISLDFALGTWPFYPPALSWAVHGFVVAFLLRVVAAYPEPAPDPRVPIGALILLGVWVLITAVNTVPHISL